MWGRIQTQMLGAKPNRLPPPPQITHPGRHQAPAKKPISSPDEVRRFFAQHVAARR